MVVLWHEMIKDFNVKKNKLYLKYLVKKMYLLFIFNNTIIIINQIILIIFSAVFRYIEIWCINIEFKIQYQCISSQNFECELSLLFSISQIIISLST